MAIVENVAVVVGESKSSPPTPLHFMAEGSKCGILKPKNSIRQLHHVAVDAVVAVENQVVLSHLQHLVDVKVRGM